MALQAGITRAFARNEVALGILFTALGHPSFAVDPAALGRSRCARERVGLAERERLSERRADGCPRRPARFFHAARVNHRDRFHQCSAAVAFPD